MLDIDYCPRCTSTDPPHLISVNPEHISATHRTDHMALQREVNETSHSIQPVLG
jgi:hypothetical protein